MSLQVAPLLVSLITELAAKTRDLDNLVPTKVDNSVYLVEGVFSLWVVGPIICHSTFDGLVDKKISLSSPHSQS